MTSSLPQSRTWADVTCHCRSISHLFYLDQRSQQSAPKLPVHTYTDALSRSISGQLISTYAILPHTRKIDTPETLLGCFKSTKRERVVVWKEKDVGGNSERQRRKHAERKEEKKAEWRERRGEVLIPPEEDTTEKGEDEEDERKAEKLEEGEVIEVENGGETYYFCRTCGAHVYLHSSAEGYNTWSVASGLLNAESLPLLQNTASSVSTALSTLHRTKPETKTEDILPASCACSSVQFYIAKPSNNTDVKSPYPDLMKPYHTHSSANPSDEKWWVVDEDKYLAGTCMCATCRLVSGFPIQFWTFIPRENILINKNKNEEEGLDLIEAPEDLHFGSLVAYKSRGEVRRLFCGKCGCTVFYQNTERPELVDVSVGVLGGTGEGRYGDWLSWWKDRVSFSEMAVDGQVKRILEEHVKKW